MNYQVFGPFELPRVNNRIEHSKDAKKKFWESVDKKSKDLGEGCGCYIFTTQNVVRYVGMANRQSFKKECLAPHKIILFNDALASGKGIPRLILIARRTGKGSPSKPSKKTGHRDVTFLEGLLIGLAYNRNPGILNIKGTKLHADLHVPGLLNTKPGEARSKSVQSLKKALGL